jgi:O-antigen ligase
MYFKPILVLLALTSNAFTGLWFIAILFYSQRIKKIKGNLSNIFSLLIFILLIVCMYISVSSSGFNSSSISFVMAFILSFCFLWIINSIVCFKELITIFAMLSYYFIGVTLLNLFLGHSVTQTSGLFLDRNYFSGIFALCLLSLFFAILDLEPLSLKKILFIITLLIGFFCIIIIQSRTPVYALVFLIALYLTFTKNLQILVIISVVSILGVFYVSMVGFDFDSRYFNAGTAQQSNNYRFVLILTAIEIFKDNFYFGVGPNLFREYSLIIINSHLSEYGLPKVGSGLVAHSSYMQALAELGFLFAALMSIQLLFAGFLLFQKKDWRKLVLFFYICIISLTMEYLSSPIFISALFANLFYLKGNRNDI